LQKLEKRTRPRQSLQIPLRSRVTEACSPEPELASETSNISLSGLFMKGPLSLRVGSPLAITLRVPPIFSFRQRAFHSSMHGPRRPRTRTSNGDIGYGIQFENLLSFQQPSVSQTVPAHTQSPVNSSS
jgi:hypothetical protein